MQLAPLASFTLLAASLVSAHTRPSFLPERRLASNAAAAPSHDNNSYACSVGNAYCCNTAISDKASKKTVSNLAGLDDIEGMVALQCSSIPVLAGALQNQCKATPVCCTHVHQSGLINLGCNAIPIN